MGHQIAEETKNADETESIGLLVRKLGECGMSAVNLAEHALLGRNAAIRVLR